MQPTKKRALIAAATGSLATLALAGALLTPLMARAQDDTSTPTSTVTAQTPAPPVHNSRHFDRSSDHDAALAEALGISADELQAAREAANQAAIDAAVEEGLITEAQATMMRMWEGRRSGPGAPGFGPMGNRIDMDALLAEQLGISVDELNAAEDKVFAAELAAAVEAGDLTQEQADLVAARQAFQRFLAPRLEQAYGDAITAALDEGILTQEQADLLESMGMHSMGMHSMGMHSMGMHSMGMRGGRPGGWGMGRGFLGQFPGGHGPDDFGKRDGRMPEGGENRSGRGRH